MSQGYCKLKQDSITHLLEWIKSRILITQNAGEDVEQKNSHSLLVGIAICQFLIQLNIFTLYDPALVVHDI